MAEPPHPLAGWLAYLESTGQKPCTCRWEWRPGLSEWVRVTTEADCQEHGTVTGA